MMAFAEMEDNRDTVILLIRKSFFSSLYWLNDLRLNRNLFNIYN